MRQLLIDAFKEAISQIEKGLRTMPLERWNESVFRFVYSGAVAKQERTVIQFPECNRIDLVLHRGSERAFVEFKFCLHDARYDPLTADRRGWKGGPGSKNYREFKKCVDTLRRRSRGSKVLKLVALFYADPASTKRKKYDASYGHRSGVERELNIKRLARTRFRYNGSEGVCNARLYKVLT